MEPVRLDEVSENKSVMWRGSETSPARGDTRLVQIGNYRINKLIFMKPHLPGSKDLRIPTLSDG